MSNDTNKKHFLLLEIEQVDAVIVNTYIVKLMTGGDPETIVEAIAMAIVGSSRFREIVNKAGSMANKIRRGEMAAPGKFNISDN